MLEIEAAHVVGEKPYAVVTLARYHVAKIPDFTRIAYLLDEL